MPAKHTTDTFIAKSKNVHGDRYEYDRVKYSAMNVAVMITCRLHGDFQQKPAKHLTGKGCIKCRKTKRGQIARTMEEYIAEFKAVHGDTYDYSRFIKVSGLDKGTIICRTHGPFDQQFQAHLRGNGCPRCSGRRTTEDWVDAFKKAHGEKFDYTNFEYQGHRVRFSLLCDNHGPFTQTPQHHADGHGCNKCGEERTAFAQKIPASCWEEMCEVKYGNLFDYSQCEFGDARTVLKIGCLTHGAFLQSAAEHLKRGKCPTCSRLARKLDQKTFVARAISFHGQRYDYRDVVYKGLMKPITIICSKHGSFDQLAGNHLAGNGCPKCFNRASNPEKRFLDALGIENDQRQIRINRPDHKMPYFVDGYDPKTNTVYELDGDFWHGNPCQYDPSAINPLAKKTFGELYESTQRKTDELIGLGFNVVRVWESELNVFIEKIGDNV